MTAQAPTPLKIVVIGDGGVGKSCITMALLKREFSDEYDPTVEDAYSMQTEVDGVIYAIELVDTAGQEEYRGLWSETSAREADGFVVVYSIESKSSFDLLPDFLHLVRKVRSPDDVPSRALTPQNTPFAFLLVGNKCDLPPTSRTVTAQQGLGFARQGGGLFSEVSAKNRVNIESAFQQLVRSVARSKALHREHLSRLPGRVKVDDGLFNPNIALHAATPSTSSPPTPLSLSPRPSLSNVTYSPNEKQQRRGKRDPGLQMDRRRSLSVGGLGADPETLRRGDKDGGGCGCVVC